jgi:hypothetical protein
MPTTNDDLEAKLDKILATLHEVTGAFAKGADGTVDFDGHRRYHESMIRAANAQERFWVELKLEIAKKGVWGLLIIVVGLVAIGVSTKLGLGK